MRKVLINSLILLTLSLAAANSPATEQDEIAAIKQDLQRLTERLAALEAREKAKTHVVSRVDAADSADVATTASKADWPERIKINGDVRYRHEGIDEEGKAERIRQRVRARIDVAATVGENAEVAVQLATGSDDPISANQTLGDGASTKEINLNLAYFAIRPTADTQFIGGKMKNPLFRPGKSSLLWDGDLNPEGLAWQYAGDKFFANIAGHWLDERKVGADATMIGGQAGARTTLADGSKLTFGAGYYDYGATKGEVPFYDADARGNTVDSSGNYAFDFKVLELFAELSTQLGDMPFSVFADWARNSAAGSQDSAILYGARIGKASAPASWDFGYDYRDIEADSVVAIFSDSDVGGGGTAISGHRFDFGYAFTRKIQARLTYIISENDSGMPTKRDYNRVQADLSLKY